ncbi:MULTISPECIES: MFS transporter [unclassified Paludibacterium]|uniref:MFS transporter n=1 Tax=unclassified Paludibacterium TaxID=2618429 RepID=UPI001C04E4F3|nr:MFS transporter [Paludibacterium sp. B53371]BEV71231.1 sugar efflux transporter SetB [Paludibacterium sp. THUN1379]
MPDLRRMLPPRPDATATAFICATFLTGIASALQTPTLSLFLSGTLHADAAMVGLFYVFSALIGIAVSQGLAAYSDRISQRNSLILKCCLIGAGGCLMYALVRSYLVLLIAGSMLLSMGSAANSQIFALAREYADQSGREAALFNALLRAQISLAWVAGPPLAFMLALGFGFRVMYGCAALVFILCGTLTWHALPRLQKAPRAHPARREAVTAPRRAPQRDILLLSLTFALLGTSNCLYLINMPLYLAHDLHQPARWAGWLMGCAAGLEIPVMLLAGLWSRRVGKRRLVQTALLAGLLFYPTLLLAQHLWQLLALQLLNALFVGITAGIGMPYFQDMMPGRAGSATTLYSNAMRCGWIVAGGLTSVLAQTMGYRTVFGAAFLLALLSLCCLQCIGRPLPLFYGNLRPRQA